LWTQKGDQDRCRRVDTRGVVEQVHQQAGAKREEKHQYRTDLEGQEQDKTYVDEAESGVKQYEIPYQQNLRGNE
jgi:hypothetical protein